MFPVLCFCSAAASAEGPEGAEATAGEAAVAAATVEEAAGVGPRWLRTFLPRPPSQELLQAILEFSQWFASLCVAYIRVSFCVHAVCARVVH